MKRTGFYKLLRNTYYIGTVRYKRVNTPAPTNR